MKPQDDHNKRQQQSQQASGQNREPGGVSSPGQSGQGQPGQEPQRPDRRKHDDEEE